MGGEPPPQMWDAGADYLRLTYVARGEEAYRMGERYRGAVGVLAKLAADDSPPKAWTWMGYEGTQVGTAAWGLGEQGCIFQVSGPLAHNALLLDLPRTGVPRLDLQVTTWGEPSPQDIPRHVSRETLSAREGARGRPWKIALIDGFGSGDTCYIGSRTSDCFIRVYDKGAETASEDYAGSVRYEVELKGAEAVRTYARLVQDAPEARSSAAGLVRGILASRGVSLPDWIQIRGEARNLAVRAIPSADRSCAWLQSQVSPTVRRLMQEGVSYELLHRILFGRPHSHDVDDLPGGVIY